MLKINSSTIINKISEFKKKDIENFQTNYFLTPLAEEILFLENDGAFVFLQPEFDFYRLYFVTNNLDKLASLLDVIPEDIDICLNYICKNEIDKRLLTIITTKFYLFVKHEKLRLKFIKNKKIKTINYAESNDLETIYNSLHSNFSKYSDFLPTREKLNKLINNKTVIVNRQSGKVLGYIIYNYSGFTVDFNYFYNNSTNILNAAILTNNFYTDIAQRGFKNVFLWVDIKNTKVKKAHLSSGYFPDGTFNYIFRMRK